MTRPVTLSHSRITARTHAPRAASRWIAYIQRSNACLATFSAHLEEGGERRFVFDREAALSRQPHRRIVDRVMGTFVAGTTPEEAAAVVERFVGSLARLRATAADPAPRRFPFVACVHALGRDAGNPHAHFAFVDEDIDTRVGGEPHTGRTAVGFADIGSTERLREAWADAINAVYGSGETLVSAVSYRRLAARAEAAGDAELAAYYRACDAAKAVHLGPAMAAAVRAGRPVFEPRYRASAAAYRASYEARVLGRRTDASPGLDLPSHPVDGARAQARTIGAAKSISR